MFMRLAKNGRNSMSMLLPGEYTGSAQTFVGHGEVSGFALIHWTRVATSEVVAAEWLAYWGDGRILYCDYLKLPNGTWRDSDGKIGPSVNSLLPGNFEGMVLFDEESAGTELLDPEEGLATP